jgi:fatty acid desaturase
MGDYSPLGTLLLNEQAKEDFSGDVIDYLFLHEVGHDRMGFIGRSLFWAMYLTSGLSFIGAVIALPRTLLMAVEYAPSLAWLPIYIAVVFGLTLVLGLPFVAVSWIDETLAELFAISKLGVDKYSAIRKETKSESDASWLRRIRIRIQYPPDSVILWIAQRREIGQKEKTGN